MPWQQFRWRRGGATHTHVTSASAVRRMLLVLQSPRCPSSNGINGKAPGSAVALFNAVLDRVLNPTDPLERPRAGACVFRGLRHRRQGFWLRNSWGVLIPSGGTGLESARRVLWLVFCVILATQGMIVRGNPQSLRRNGGAGVQSTNSPAGKLPQNEENAGLIRSGSLFRWDCSWLCGHLQWHGAHSNRNPRRRWAGGTRSKSFFAHITLRGGGGR